MGMLPFLLRSQTKRRIDELSQVVAVDTSHTREHGFILEGIFASLLDRCRAEHRQKRSPLTYPVAAFRPCALILGKAP